MKTAFLLSIVRMVGFGAAALLDTYGTITGTATVNQSVVLSGEGCDLEDDNACTYTIANSPMYGDSTHMSDYFTLTNRANVDVYTSFTNDVSGTSDGTGSGCPADGGTWLMEEGVASVKYYIYDESTSTYVENDGTNVVVPADNGKVYLKIETTFANACPGTYEVVVNANTVTQE